MTPKVSVCMPTYNQAQYLPEAIESVLAQTFHDFEFIIIDDGSSDGSAEIIARYAARDSRIRFERNEPNAGMVNNWNRCLERARGDYIKYLFGDDMFLSPHTVEKMARLLDGHPEVALVASARHEIDGSSRFLKLLSPYAGDRTCRGPEVIMDCILEQRNRIGEPSAVMFRKKQALRGFDARFKQIVDLEMWFSLLEQGALAYLAEPLVAFRVHPGQQTRMNSLNLALIDEPFLLLDRYADKPYVALSRLKKWYMNYVPLYAIWKLYTKHGKLDRQQAGKHIRKRASLAGFFALYPVFKLFRAYVAMTRAAREPGSCQKGSKNGK
jgi:glycosyltransferase involved in cell wall biosynthesis